MNARDLKRRINNRLLTDRKLRKAFAFASASLSPPRYCQTRKRLESSQGKRPVKNSSESIKGIDGG
jgi:hypothetical protein